MAGLVPGKRGPKGPSRLTPEVVADITARRSEGATLAQIGDALSVAPNTARRALLPPVPEEAERLTATPTGSDLDVGGPEAHDGVGVDAMLKSGQDNATDTDHGREPQLRCWVPQHRAVVNGR